ncbi:MAG: hypothetical protein P4L84_33625 [Isosphaeraceae bacterium]|nr:hypothetical protein [Isosphaeraceae bacterium]
MYLTNNILVNSVALYRFTPAQDADAGVVGDDSAYPVAFAIGVRCSVQPERPERMTDQERISGSTVWNVVFRSNPGLSVNDRIVWVDDTGAARKLIVTLGRNLAGRSGAWEVRCEERI